MIKKIILFLGLINAAVRLEAQTPYTFTRDDSVVVKFNTDTFELAWAGGINYAQFSNIDYNFDGMQDLFVFDRTGNKPLCFEFVGTPGSTEYRYAPEYEEFFPTMLYWSLLKDYDCDGLNDIFTYTPGGIKVYKNISTPGNIAFQLIVNQIKSWQLGNYVNLYVSSVDLPGLADIDEDSDLDVLTFGVFGTTLEYHKNYSFENGFGCDSFQFNLMNQCWGCFQEDPATNNVFLNDTCNNAGIPNPELAEIIQAATEEDVLMAEDPSRSGARHSGSCTCVLDLDGDKMKEIIMGDVSFSNQVMVHNGATTFNNAECMDTADTLFPSYDDPVILELFPCSFYVEINNDNKRDLIVTPQSTLLSENQRSVLYYYNSVHDTLPYFNFVQRDFLQYEMIDKGEGSSPVLTDYNGDGLLDLFVANYGSFNSANDTYVSRLALYVNAGTTTNPVYNLLTDNFAALDLVLGQRNMIPTFGDLDNDGDDDMVVGNETGTMAYFQNTAGAGNPYNFSIVLAGMVDDASALIDVGQYSAPLLVDIDRDGDLDLVVGNKSGKLSYYRNTGTVSAPMFKYITDYLGQLNVKEWWDNSGYSIPAVVDSSGNYNLFIGSKSGYIHHYDNIDGNVMGAYNRVDTTVFQIPVGLRSACTLADVNGDGRTDIITGNYRGGLTFYKGDPDGSSAINEIEENHFSVYPNPSSDKITVVNDLNGVKTNLVLYDLMGKEIATYTMNSGTFTFTVSELPVGVYLLKANYKNSTQIIKIIRYE